MAEYRTVRYGVDRVAGGDVPRHLHRLAYATVVLEGAFVEAAFAGRSCAGPGTVLLHGPFDGHADKGGGAGRGPTIVRLPWYGDRPEGAYRARDPDLLARLVGADPREAAAALDAMIEPAAVALRDWTDELATALVAGHEMRLRAWAEARGRSASALSRAFRADYGVTPQRFRLEARTRLAWRQVVASDAPLTAIAHDCGFADLAHMSRNVAAMTGRSPRAWRRAAALGLDPLVTPR